MATLRIRTSALRKPFLRSIGPVFKPRAMNINGSGLIAYILINLYRPSYRRLLT